MAIEGGGGTIGGAEFEVVARVNDAELQEFLDGLSKRAKSAAESLSKLTGISTPFAAAVQQIDRLRGTLGFLQSAVKDIDLDPELQNQLDEFEDKINDIRSLLGDLPLFERESDDVKVLQREVARLEGMFKGITLPPEAAERVRELREQIRAIQTDLGAVGGRRIDLPVANLGEELKGIDKSIAEINRRWAGFHPPPEVDAQLKQLDARAKEIKESLGGIADRRVNLTVVTKSQDIQNAANEIKVLNRQLRDLEASFDAAAKPEVAAEIKRVEERIAALGGQVRSASGALKPLKTDFQQIIDRMKELRKESAELSAAVGKGVPAAVAARKKAIEAELSELEKGLGGIAAPTNFLERAFAKFGNVTDSVNRKLAGLGLTGRDLAVILGAGFLSSGVALIAQQLIQLAAAAAKAIFEMAKLGGQVITLREQVDAVFGEEAAGEVRDWAATTAASLGLSERAALEMSGRLGILFQNMGATKEEAAFFSQGLIDVASVLKRVTPGVGSLSDVVRDLESTIGGNIEGLKKYLGALNETDLKLLGLKETGIEFTGELTAQERGLLAYVAALDQAIRNFEIYEKINKGVGLTTEELNAHIENLKTELGVELAPVLRAVLEGLISFIRFVRDGVKDVKAFVKENDAFFTVLKEIVDLSLKQKIGEFTGLIKGVGLLIKILEPLAKLLSKISEGQQILLKLIGLGKDETDKSTESNKKNAVSIDNLRETKEKVIEKIKELRAQREHEIDQLESLRDAHIRLDRAIEDGAQNVEKAQIARDRAIEDAAYNAEQAQRKVTKAYKDRNRAVGDALKKIADVERQNKRALADAEDNLKDAQEQRLKDIEQAEDRVAEAQKRRAENILDATLAVERAMREQNALAFNQAQIDLARARQKDDVRKAEEDLQETRVEALEKVAEAEEKLRRVVEDNTLREQEARENLRRVIEDTAEKIEEAQRDLARQEVENNRRLFDSRRALEEASENAKRQIDDANRALDDMNHKFGTTDLTLDSILKKIRAIRGTLEDIEKMKIDIARDPGNVENGPFSVHRLGGTIRPGEWGLVGEEGPEFIRGGSTGTSVFPFNGRRIDPALLAWLQQIFEQWFRMSGDRSFTKGRSAANINIFEAVDAEATAFAVMSRLGSEVNN